MAGVKDAAAEAPLAQGRRRDPARRDRQAADEPAAVELPARAGAVRRRSPKRRGCHVDETLARTRRLLDGRIIREITPIFDTRALGFDSMLVAAKVDAENPHRAAKIINSHPGVSHNYLRTHEFNLWFTIATPPDSELGLQGSLDALQRLTGAESIRQLPTLKLFKINMNLEMEDGTEALASVAEAATPRELERQPYDDFDVAVIRALQGPMAPVERPYDEAAAEVGLPVERFLEHLEGMVERKLLRRVAAILYHRRAGFSANGMGVWKVPDEQILEVGARMASVRGDLALLRAAHVRGLAVLGLHDGPRPLEGGVRRDPPVDRRRARASTATTARRSTPRPSSRRSACTTSPRTTRGGKPRTRSPGHANVRGHLRAGRRAPAGRGQLAGAGDALDRPRPPDLRRARRGLRADRRRRPPLRGLGLLVGAADPGPRASGGRRGGPGRRGAGHLVRRADRGRGRARGRGLRPVRLGRDGADDVVRHRGLDERDPARARGDGPGRRS